MSGPTSPGFLLPSVAYRPRPAKGTKIAAAPPVSQTRNVPRNLERRPQVSEPVSDSDSEIEDDFPTPRASNAVNRIVSPPTSATFAPVKVPLQTIAQVVDTHDVMTSDDDLYTISSDDDSEIIPIKISNSVKRMVTQQQPPPLMLAPIRTMTKVGLSRRNASTRRSHHATPLSPAALARLQSVPLRSSSKASAPSLDGSLTSEEQTHLDPSTPDLRSEEGFGNDWEMPVQLSPKAMTTLHNLAIDATPISIDTIVQATDLQVHEMKDRGLNISVITHTQDFSSSEIEPMSAISIPSPGGFFASLPPSIQSVWSTAPDPKVPTTSMAESFYDLPWGPRTSSITERFVEINDNGTEGPPTARRLVLSPRHTEDVAEQRRLKEFDESYDHKLFQEASSKLNRTSMWLSQLEAYNPSMAEAVEHKVHALTASPDLAGPRSPPPTAALPPAPAPSVRGATSSESLKTPARLPSSSLIYNAFQHLYQPSSPKNDAFTHRQPRYDAVQMQRLYSLSNHISQLSSSFNNLPSTSSVADADFSHLPTAPVDPSDAAHQTALANASTQQKALDAISLNVWNLQAHRLLNGDSLLPRCARTALRLANKAGMTPTILDLGGNPTADWAWAVATEYREAKVYTAVLENGDQEDQYPKRSKQAWKAHKGPSNHRVVEIDATWKLPFADETFDVISARSLYQLCRLRNVSIPAPAVKTSPKMTAGKMTQNGNNPQRTSKHRSRTSATYIPGMPDGIDTDDSDDDGFTNPPVANRANTAPPTAPLPPLIIEKDELDATLSEIRRVLVPGGVLSFEVFDAEIKNLDQPGMPGISSMTALGFSSSSGEGMGQTAGTQQGTAALAARSSDFVGLLERGGYDAAGSGMFVSRLVDAEFGRVERAWLSLPVDQTGSSNSSSSSSSSAAVEGNNGQSNGKDRSMESVTGLVGSLAWEKWMLKVQREAGKDETRLLNGVGQALEGVRKDGGRQQQQQQQQQQQTMGWTMLVGACRKAGGGKRCTS